MSAEDFDFATISVASDALDDSIALASLSAEQEELLALLIEEENLEANVPIRNDWPSDEAPLAFVQEQLWLLDQLTPGDPAYNVSIHLAVSGNLDIDALESSLSVLIARHEPLRTGFAESAGRPLQVILPPRAVLLTIVDLRATPDDVQQTLTEDIALQEGRRPFDLQAGYLFRATVVLQAARKQMLLLTVHHIVFDVWSSGPLLRELLTLYEARRTKNAALSLPAPALQYRDFIRWQRYRLNSRRLEQLRAFWQQYLAESVPLLPLPTDRPRPTRQTFHGARFLFRISREQTMALRALGRTAEASLFVTALAIFKVLLYRYTGQADIVVGSPAGNRHRAEFENLIGFFVDVVALRTAFDPQEGFRRLLTRARQSMLSAFEHQDMPFSLLVDALKVPRDLSHNPIFQVSFALIGKAPPFPDVDDLSVSPINSDNRTAKFDITLDFFEDADGLSGSIEYNTDLFEASTIARMAGHYQTLVNSAVAEPERPIAELELLTAEERQTLLFSWNPVSPLAPERCIHEEIAARAQQMAQAPALTVGDQTLTYAELMARAGSFMQELRAIGVGPDVLVGVHLPRSVDLVVAVLAILMAGGAYVPLDPNYPRERTALIVEDASLAAILTTRTLASGLAHPKLVFVDDERQGLAQSNHAPAAPVTPKHLAYVLYTSGSTGRPQGVEVEHRNAVGFFAAMDKLFDSPQSGTWLAVTSLSFDISVLELLWTLSRGLHVVLQRELTVAPLARRAPAQRDVDLSLFFFAADSGESSGNLYDLLLRSVKRADELGFASVFVPERHFHEFGGPYPNPSVIGAAIAATTSRIKICAGSVVIPLHDPIRVAEEWAVVDNLSGGRVGLALASGWHADDFVFAPDRYESRKTDVVSGLDVIQRLWRGESIRRLNGNRQEIEVRVYPRPVQTEIPIWLTAAGNIETFRIAGKRGKRVLTHLLGQRASELGEKITAYRKAYQEAGHPGRGHVTLMVHCFLGTDLANVHAKVRRPFLSYLRSSVDLTARLIEQLGAGGQTLSPQDIDTLLEHGYERYIEHNALIGTPRSCRALFDTLCDVGVDEIAGLVDFGVPTEDALASLELFAELRKGTFASNENDESIASQIARHGVTHLQCTPSLARLLVQDPQARAAVGTLREFLVGGEALPLQLARQLADAVPGAVRNMYGPTETTVWSTSYHVPAGCDAVRIGSPLENNRVYVLDSSRRLVPIGVIGEVYIGGPAVTRGYHRRPELTAERYVDDPFVPGTRMYRTGDLGRMCADGTIEFLGRRDSQVKLRGHRIELGEVEGALRRNALVADAAAAVHPDAAGEPQLCAYVVPSAEGASKVAAKASTEHVSTWQALWDRTYNQTQPTGENAHFWTAGWTSSYTGEAIASEAMQEWVEQTVSRIRKLEPRRLLEIGCGTGMLLFRLAAHCDSYIAQDFSRAALDHVQAETQRLDLRHVTLVEAPAESLDHVAPESLDTIVLNSVAQYFPSADYLMQVLEQAVARVRDGGSVFLGDIRDLRLLRAQIASVLVYRANKESPDRTAQSLYRDLERRVSEEEELLVDKGIFTLLRERVPRVQSIRVLRKEGQHDTEMTRFRHDVILRIGRAASPERVAFVERPWGELTPATLPSVLREVSTKPLILRDMPDRRLAGPASIVRALKAAESQEWTAAKLFTAEAAAEAAAVDLEQLRSVARDMGLAIEVSVPASGAEECSDVVIWNPAHGDAPTHWSDPPNVEIPERVANDPLRAKQLRTLVPALREHLQHELPDFMLPSAFVLLEKLPRTPNGKIARRALPAPERTTTDRRKKYVAPSSPTEVKLAGLWSQVLGIERFSAEEGFFDLGGHSFSAAQLAFHIRSTFGRDLALSALFAAPTLSGMARLIEGNA